MDSTGRRDHKGRALRLGSQGRDRQVCRRWLPAAVAALTAIGSANAPAVAGALSVPGCLDGGDPSQVTAVGSELDPVLADGRHILLPGIDPAPSGDRVAAISRWLAGRSVLVRSLSAEPDRWNCTPALIFAAGPELPSGDIGPGQRISVIEALLDAGLARARPDARVSACWPTLLALERHAREAGIGLWKQPRFAVIPADDRGRLVAETGRMAIVEGRIAGVTERRTRTYLNFGATGRGGFTVSVERRVAAKLKAAGTDVASWRGRQVRVRGFLDDRFGLQIELTTTDQIEFTEGT